jgi:hypothetical protein
VEAPAAVDPPSEEAGSAFARSPAVPLIAAGAVVAVMLLTGCGGGGGVTMSCSRAMATDGLYDTYTRASVDHAISYCEAPGALASDSVTLQPGR